MPTTDERTATDSPSNSVTCSKAAQKAGDRIITRILGDRYGGRETDASVIAEYVQDAIDSVIAAQASRHPNPRPLGYDPLVHE